jgi:hypothetical protein
MLPTRWLSEKRGAALGFADDGQDAGVAVGVVLSAHGSQLAVVEKADERKSGEEVLDEAEVVVRLAVQADAPTKAVEVESELDPELDRRSEILEIRAVPPGSPIQDPTSTPIYRVTVKLVCCVASVPSAFTVITTR